MNPQCSILVRRLVEFGSWGKSSLVRLNCTRLACAQREFDFAGNLAGIIAPLAIGLLIKWSGSYVPGFALGSMVLLVGLLAYWFIVGELKPRSS